MSSEEVLAIIGQRQRFRPCQLADDSIRSTALSLRENAPTRKSRAMSHNAL
jgi:hypothetical protein